MVGMNQIDSPLRMLFRSFGAASAQMASDALIEGLILGYNPRKVAPMVRDALGIQLNRALTICRTEVLRAHREAAHQIYAENADVVKGWRWQAALSGNTCAVCISLHGREFPMSEKMSSHPNCRCCAAPITYSWEELGKRFGVDWSGVDDAGPSFEELAKKYNMSPEQIARYRARTGTGVDYFKSLTPEEQRKILGPAKWLAWKEGKFEFSSLAVKTWSPEWGEGKTAASLTELLGEKDAAYYKKLVWNGLAKENLSADELIKFASLELRPLNGVEINKIVEHVMTQGYDDNLLQKVPAMLDGFEFNGKTVSRGDMIGSGINHYLKHVIRQQEWPDGTTYNDYLASIREVLSDPNKEIVVSHYEESLQIGFLADSGKWRGVFGYGKIWVEYRPKISHIITAFQLNDIEELFENQPRTGIVWISRK